MKKEKKMLHSLITDLENNITHWITAWEIELSTHRAYGRYTVVFLTHLLAVDQHCAMYKAFIITYYICWQLIKMSSKRCEWKYAWRHVRTTHVQIQATSKHHTNIFEYLRVTAFVEFLANIKNRHQVFPSFALICKWIIGAVETRNGNVGILRSHGMHLKKMAFLFDFYIAVQWPIFENIP